MINANQIKAVNAKSKKDEITHQSVIVLDNGSLVNSVLGRSKFQTPITRKERGIKDSSNGNRA